MLAPCKDCQKRTLYCHCYCEDYKAFLKELAETKKKKEHERYLSAVKFGRYPRKKY